MFDYIRDIIVLSKCQDCIICNKKEIYANLRKTYLNNDILYYKLNHSIRSRSTFLFYSMTNMKVERRERRSNVAEPLRQNRDDRVFI